MGFLDQRSLPLNRFFSKLGVTEVDKAISTQARLYMYRNTIDMIKDNFLLGVGFGNFKYVYPRYRDRVRVGLIGIKYPGRTGSQ